MSNEILATLMDRIREAAAAQPNPGRFLQDLQTEIETIPGAYVSFASRDLNWIEGYVEDRSEIGIEDRQAALVGASLDYDEGFGSQDGISYAMNAWLDEYHPRPDQEDEEIGPGS